MESHNRPEEPTIGRAGRARHREDIGGQRVVDSKAENHLALGRLAGCEDPGDTEGEQPTAEHTPHNPSGLVRGYPISAWIMTDGNVSRAELIASSMIALIRSAAGRKGQVFSGRSTARAAAKAKAATLSTFMPSPCKLLSRRRSARCRLEVRWTLLAMLLAALMAGITCCG
jgi:hypothetical protein